MTLTSRYRTMAMNRCFLSVCVCVFYNNLDHINVTRIGPDAQQARDNLTFSISFVTKIAYSPSSSRKSAAAKTFTINQKKNDPLYLWPIHRARKIVLLTWNKNSANNVNVRSKFYITCKKLPVLKVNQWSNGSITFDGRFNRIHLQRIWNGPDKKKLSINKCYWTRNVSFILFCFDWKFLLNFIFAFLFFNIIRSLAHTHNHVNDQTYVPLELVFFLSFWFLFFKKI